jgi:AcrR family transcriptional regulator
MARPSNPAIRRRLCDQAVDYVLAHGVAELALRPLAKALKTNARMLLYHFGSREELMRQILIRLREREDARIQSWFRSNRKSRSLAEFLRWYWRRMSAPRARPVMLLIFELYALALRNPQQYPGVLEDPIAYWKSLAKKDGASSDVDAAEATLLLGATRGLLLDLCATGDRARVSRGMELMAGLIESHRRPMIVPERRKRSE